MSLLQYQRSIDSSLIIINSDNCFTLLIQNASNFIFQCKVVVLRILVLKNFYLDEIPQNSHSSGEEVLLFFQKVFFNLSRFDRKFCPSFPIHYRSRTLNLYNFRALFFVSDCLFNLLDQRLFILLLIHFKI